MNAYTKLCAAGLALCLTCLLSLSAAGPALAHRVNIFAWLEGENVHVESSFRRDAPVQGGTVVVLDLQTGAELLRGRTDREGAFVFPVPAAARQGHGLRIRILAGEGHQNEWCMDAAEFSSLTSSRAAASAPAAAASGTGGGSAIPSAREAGDDATPATTAAAASTKAAAGATTAPGAAASGTGTVPAASVTGTGIAPASSTSGAGAAMTAALGREELETIVDAALERHLAPLRRSLAAASEAGPDLKDIVGGLGWIMGLVGIGLYFSRRRP